MEEDSATAEAGMDLGDILGIVPVVEDRVLTHLEMQDGEQVQFLSKVE
jgi:hypothetical protein